MDPNTDDVNLFQRIKAVPIVKTMGDAFAGYVAESALDLDIRIFMEEVTCNLKYIEVDGVWHMFATDWYAAARQMRSVLNARMRLRLLALGVLGPSAIELKTAPTLSGWLPIRTEDNLGAALAGEVAGHQAHFGPLIITTALCGIDPDRGCARTISRWYRLENMVTVEQLYEKWGTEVDGISAAALEFWQAQARVASEQAFEGFRYDD